MIPSRNQRTPLIESQSAGGLLLIATWFALFNGLIEVWIRAVQKLFLGQIIHLSPHVVWMAPLANLILFSFVGIVLLLVRRCWPSLSSPSVVSFVFSFLVFLGPLSSFPRLQSYAAALLAAGLATQAARFIAAYPHRFYMIVRRSVVWVTTSMIVLAIGVHRRQLKIERQETANLPAAVSSAPNVLLIVLDTVRAQSLSLYGYTRLTTPNLERIARRGVVFDRALSTSPWTLPSHASIFTGRLPRELSADWSTPLDKTYPTLTEVLKSQGYLTAGFAANLLYCTYEWGLQRGFVHYRDYPMSLAMIAKSSWLVRYFVEKARAVLGNDQDLVRKSAEELNREFLSWVSEQRSRPFFAFLNYMDAHDPYLPPTPYNLKYGSKQPQNPRVLTGYRYSLEEVQAFKDAYDGAIAYLDHQLGILFDALEQRALLQNTLVIITSDHGEEFGEHEVMGHGSSLYLPSLHVPLVFLFPLKVPAEERIHDVVTLRDIAATVLDLVNHDAKALLPGVSLARYWNSVAGFVSVGRDPVVSEVSHARNLPASYPISKGDMKSLALDGYRSIMNGDGRLELYDLQSDWQEQNDLSHREEESARLLEFRNLFKVWWARPGAASPRSEDSVRADLVAQPEAVEFGHRRIRALTPWVGHPK